MFGKLGGRLVLGSAVLLGSNGCVEDAQYQAPPIDDPSVRAARAAVESDPSRWIELGNYYLGKEAYFEAAESFLSAARAGVNRPDVHAGLARAYLELGYGASVTQALRACLGLDRTHPDCLFTWATLTSRNTGARFRRDQQRIWAQYLEHAPADHWGRARGESAAKELAKELGLPPAQKTSRPPNDRFDKTVQAGHLAWQEGDLAGAESKFSEALRLRVDDPEVMAALARVVQQQGDAERAMELVQKAYDAAPDLAQTRLAFGLIMFKNQRQGRQAMEAWQALLRDQPEFAQQVGLEERVRALLKEASARTEAEEVQTSTPARP